MGYVGQPLQNYGRIDHMLAFTPLGSSQDWFNTISRAQPSSVGPGVPVSAVDPATGTVAGVSSTPIMAYLALGIIAFFGYKIWQGKKINIDTTVSQ